MRSRQPLLRTKLLTWLLLPLCLLLVADAFFSYWVALRFSNRAYDRSLQEIAREVVLRIQGSDGSMRFDLPDAAQRVLFSDPSDQVYFQVTETSGTPVAGQVIAPAPVRGDGAEAFYDSEIDRVPVRVVELEVGADGPGGRPPAVVRVAETLVKRNALAREILASVVVPQLVLVLIAGALVWVGVVRGLLPLERLQRAVASRSHRDLSAVAEDDVPGEVRPLVHSINGLLERLDQVLTLQGRFIADAAHQLKTPVAGLRAQIELVMREGEPAFSREVVARLYVGVERLSRLVSQLLSLARNEPEAIRTMSLVPVDLNALAFETTTDWVPEALKKDIDLGFEGVERPLMIQGDPARLRELFDNLLDNAIRYSRNGGRVTARVSAAARPTVSVSDDGPCIPADERHRVFERFHRLLGNNTDGSGLGLAIAQEIARIHNAQISLFDDADGVGNTFSVSFPSLDRA